MLSTETWAFSTWGDDRGVLARVHSQIFTQISCLQVQKGKEPQRIEVTVSSTTFNRVNTVVPVLHLLNPEGNCESIPHVDSAFRSWRLGVVLHTFGFQQS